MLDDVDDGVARRKFVRRTAAELDCDFRAELQGGSDSCGCCAAARDCAVAVATWRNAARAKASGSASQFAEVVIVADPVVASVFHDGSWGGTKA